MKEMFQIGEVAEMMGISVQTLRYYSKRDLIQPAHINEATGYRYYSADQIHFIDRIRYLQKLGLTLDEIKVILDKNDIGLLVETLDKRKEYFKEQLEDIKNTIDNIEWYKKYFTYLDPSTDKDFADLKEMPQRYMIAVKCDPDVPKAEWHIDLHKIVHSPENTTLQLRRQYSYILDYDAFLQGHLKPKYLGLFIQELPGYISENIITLPGGKYFCFQAQLLQNDWNPYPASMYFHDKEKPSFVIASEFEDNLYEYSKCVYEIQILSSGEK